MVEKKKKDQKKKVTEPKKITKVVKKSPSKAPEKKTVIEKKPRANSKNIKEKIKKFVTSYKFLYSTFGILLILVIVLFVMVTNKNREEEKTKSDIVFSIMESNTNNAIYVDLEGLVGYQYDLKVTNYRSDRINENGATYTIVVTNDTEAEIEVLNDDNLENLMTDQKQTTITGKTLSATEREETVYHFKVKEGSKVKEGDRIRIEVNS